MPNWCSNRIEVTGPTEDVTLFLTALKENPTDDGPNNLTLLGTFVPRPESVDADGTWYEWSLANWGTKWTDDSRVVATTDRFDGVSEVTFATETAWTPPVAGLTAISEQWPTLHFILSYYEEGMCYAGAARLFAGNVHETDYTGEWPQCEDWENGDAVDAYHEAVEAILDDLANRACWGE